MAYFEYGQDLLQDVLFRGGELTALTGQTSDYLTRCKQYIQRAYEDILSFAPWPWTMKSPPGILNVFAKETNTVTITQGNTSATLGTSIASSVSGWWIQVDAKLIPYRIITHTAGTTALTIDATYKESSASASACTLWKDEYDLASDCLKPWRAWDRNNPYHEINIIQPSEMLHRHTSRYLSSSSTFSITVVGNNKVRIVPWPEIDDITIEYDYTVKPTSDLTFDKATTDVPLVPLVDRHVIADAALVLLMIDKNDLRASEIASLVTNKLTFMFTTYCLIGKFRRYVPRGAGIWR